MKLKHLIKLLAYESCSLTTRKFYRICQSRINNGNWTEWSGLKFEFNLKTRVQFEITSIISDQNCTTRGSLTTLLHPFWNRSNTGLGHFKYFITTILSQFEIKFIHFLRGKNKSFGNKSCKICYMILHVFQLPAIWSVTLNKPWGLIGCFVFSVAPSLARKKMQFKAKNGAIRE